MFEVVRGCIEVVLWDIGRESCERPDRHPYGLCLRLEEIRRRDTKVNRPQPNRIVMRLHWTSLDDHLRVKGRFLWFENISGMQVALEKCL